MIEDKKFESINFLKDPLAKEEYENCSFTNCNFSKSDLKDTVFLDCEFISCDLSMAKIGNTAFRGANFKSCKLLGLHFDECNPFLFSVQFADCQLNLSSFYKVKIKKTVFLNCRLHEVEFTQADLTGSSFSNCDLSGTIFENTLLEKVDFRSAFNFSINAEANKIKKAKFNINGLPGLLHHYDIDIE